VPSSGLSVFDNILKFLQFQLTVNVVALWLVFIGAAAGFGQPLTAVQMLWVNLVMDTLGALALGTEAPTRELLDRKPYKRNASLISRPMARNILVQSAWQLTLLLVLLFHGAEWFGVRNMNEFPCIEYSVKDATKSVDYNNGLSIACSQWDALCAGQDGSECYKKNGLSEIEGFLETCLTCDRKDYVHGTIIFNSFIWGQIFNEYNARSIGSQVNPFKGLLSNYMFFYVSVITIILQEIIVIFCGRFTSTVNLTWQQHLITVGLGMLTLVFGVLMRFIPVEEDPRSFFSNNSDEEEVSPRSTWDCIKNAFCSSSTGAGDKKEVEFTALSTNADSEVKA